MINEFGEEITEEEIFKIAEKIRGLTIQQIDNLWYKCGWIDLERGDNKALSKTKIEEIKRDKNLTLKSVRNLLMETPKKEFVEELSKIEQA